MEKSKETQGQEDPCVVVETTDKTVKKKRCFDQGRYDDPPFYDEFRPFWGPGSKYKPWKHGK